MTIAIFAMAWIAATAQHVALKSNLLADIALSPSAGIEVAVGKRWSLDLKMQGNFWTIDGHKWKHWMASPEARYWICNRFAGSFIGVHLIGGQYNFGNIGGGFDFLGSDFARLKTDRYQGWGAGGGISYGYALPLAKHWNLEGEIGVGAIYTKYDRYPCGDCGTKTESDANHIYVGPTKLTINLTYLF